MYNSDNVLNTLKTGSQLRKHGLDDIKGRRLMVIKVLPAKTRYYPKLNITLTPDVVVV